MCGPPVDNLAAVEQPKDPKRKESTDAFTSQVWYSRCDRLVPAVCFGQHG